MDRIAGDDVRHAVRLGGSAAPGGESGRGGGRRERLRGSLGATKGVGARMTRCVGGGESTRQQRDERARDGGAPHAVVTETRTRPTSPFCMTRTNIDR